VDNRRRGLTEEETRLVAEEIATILESRHACSFTPDEQASLRSLLHTKKWAAVTFLAGMGSIILWILKDAYEWIRHMVHWGQS